MSAIRKDDQKPTSEMKQQPGFEPMSAAELRQWDDLTWAMSAPEAQQHRGKVVVVHNKKVIAVGTDRRALEGKAAKLEGCPWWELAVVVVPAADLSEIPR
jgi:hypothetical protein